MLVGGVQCRLIGRILKNSDCNLDLLIPYIKELRLPEVNDLPFIATTKIHPVIYISPLNPTFVVIQHVFLKFIDMLFDAMLP